MKKKIKIIFIVLLFVINYTAINIFCAEVIDKIVAVVNDEIITQSEVEEFTQQFVADSQLRYSPEEAQSRIQQAKSDALNRLIEEKLILEEAKRRNVKIEETEVEKRLQEVKVRFDSDEAFEKAISEGGLTVDKLKERYREQLMMRALVNGIVSNNVNITPTQIASYYYGHKDEFVMPEKVKFSMILLKFKERQDKDIVMSFARELLQRINSGEDFATLATQYSEGPNAQNGGTMDFISKGTMLKEIDEAVFSLKETEVSGVIETPLGCHIVKVQNKIPESEMSLREATPLVKKRLFEREAEMIFREFLDNLKKNAYIDIK